MQSKGVDSVALWEEIFLGKSNKGSEVGTYLSPHMANVFVMQSKAGETGAPSRRRSVWGYLA